MFTASKDLRFVSKVWGYEIWIDNNKKYCGKILFIKKGHYTSWHYHKTKQETLYLQSGKLLISYQMKDDPYSERLECGDTFCVKKGIEHRLTALEDCYIIEVSTEHIEEDTVRLDEGH